MIQFAWLIDKKKEQWATICMYNVPAALVGLGVCQVRDGLLESSTGEQRNTTSVAPLGVPAVALRDTLVACKPCGAALQPGLGHTNNLRAADRFHECVHLGLVLSKSSRIEMK